MGEDQLLSDAYTLNATIRANAAALPAVPGDWTGGEFILICELHGRRRIESLCDQGNVYVG